MSMICAGLGPGSETKKIRGCCRKSRQLLRGDNLVAREPTTPIVFPYGHPPNRGEKLPDFNPCFEVIAKLSLRLSREFRFGNDLDGNIGSDRDRPVFSRNLADTPTRNPGDIRYSRPIGTQRKLSLGESPSGSRSKPVFGENLEDHSLD